MIQEQDFRYGLLKFTIASYFIFKIHLIQQHTVPFTDQYTFCA